MAGENTVSTLSGLFKEVYASGQEMNLIPDDVQLARDIEFVEREKSPGGSYHQAVITKMENGFTYAGPNPGTVVSLNSPTAGEVKDASVAGSQIYLRSRIDYETAARASSGGDRAFRRALDPVVENMTTAMWRRLEVELFYGRTPLCTIAGLSGSTFTVAAADWAPGFWAGMEGALFSCRANDAAAADEQDVGAFISAVDIDTRQITLSPATGCANTELIHFLGQRSLAAVTATAGYNSCMGLYALCTGTVGSAVTSSVTAFGISQASYSLWKATQYSCGSGPLSLQKINRGFAQLQPKGASKKYNLYVNPKAWADLANDESAQRRYANKAGGTFSVGPEGMVYYTQTGSIEIKSSSYVKEAHAFGIDPKLFKRIGATDVTFRLPDRGDEFFLHRPDEAAYELRAMSNQALFTKALGKAILFKDIVNNS